MKKEDFRSSGFLEYPYLAIGAGLSADSFIFNPITNNVIQNTSSNRKSIRNQILRERKRTLVLISCSKSKSFVGDEKKLTKDAYCSPLFLKSKQWAENRGFDYAILSAKHGILEPDEKIGDYDLTLNEITPKQKKQWASEVFRLGQRGAMQPHSSERNKIKGPDKWIILAGAAYTQPLKNHIKNNSISWDMEIEEPLKGLQVGERLAYLKEDNTLFMVASEVDRKRVYHKRRL